MSSTARDFAPRLRRRILASLAVVGFAVGAVVGLGSLAGAATHDGDEGDHVDRMSMTDMMGDTEMSDTDMSEVMGRMHGEMMSSDPGMPRVHADMMSRHPDMRDMHAEMVSGGRGSNG